VEGTAAALWALILALPSAAAALLCAVLVVRKVRHPFRTTGGLALFLRTIIGLVFGAIVFLAVLVGGVTVAMGRF
jgi:hypothetical protein